MPDPTPLPCPYPHCRCEDVIVQREESGPLITRVDEQNGPTYCVECSRCLARGPVSDYAIDAVVRWNQVAAAAAVLLVGERDPANDGLADEPLMEEV